MMIAIARRFPETKVCTLELSEPAWLIIFGMTRSKSTTACDRPSVANAELRHCSIEFIALRGRLDRRFPATR